MSNDIPAESGLLPAHVRRIAITGDPESPGGWIVTCERKSASDDAPAGHASHRFCHADREHVLSALVSWLCTDEGFVPLQAREVATRLLAQPTPEA